jgi:hypothetical protein
VDQDAERDVKTRVRRTNWGPVALIAGAIFLGLMIAYVAMTKNGNPDKLTNAAASSGTVDSNDKACANNATYDLIKRELFRRAAETRGNDQAAYDRMAGYAVVRMENPVMESEDSATGAVNCSGSLSLDLPPGVSASGGRRTLHADIDYTVQPGTGASARPVELRNVEAIIAPLATLARVAGAPAPQPQASESDGVAPDERPANSAVPEPAQSPSNPGRPGFDCNAARTHGQVAVCQDSGLAALDVNMSGQLSRAYAQAAPDQRDLLDSTRERFLAYVDRCPNRQCIANAYIGRMREIRDIMEGRWRAPR